MYISQMKDNFAIMGMSFVFEYTLEFSIKAEYISLSVNKKRIKEFLSCVNSKNSLINMNETPMNFHIVTW